MDNHLHFTDIKVRFCQGQGHKLTISFSFRTLCRLIILYEDRRILSHPTISPVDRQLLKGNNATVLPRSGRVINSITDGKKILRLSEISNKRVSLTDPKETRPLKRPEEPKPKELNLTRTLGEVTYVCEPLVHLAARAKFGPRSWKPWLLSLTLDMVSQGCHGDLRQMSKAEKTELYRRRTLMLIYLLRSPFYDRYTKKILLSFLIFAKDNIPLGGKIAEILLSYIPHYRNIYSYLWSK